MMEIYDRIKLRREMLNLSQMELAETLGYKSRSSIAKIEAGVNDLPQSKIKAFADALETTPSYLMGWTDDPYDYDLDPDNRFDQISSSLLEHLKETYDNDLEMVWKAYQAIQDDTSMPAHGINLPDNLIPLPNMNKIPLVGTIACGTPILAEQNIMDYVDIPEHIHADFALKCKGPSMTGAGINDGDIVYIRKQPTVYNGQIAAVLINDEATLKRFRRTGDTVILQAENPLFDPLVYTREEINNISIIGLAVAHTRSLKGI